jgi:hypothetical protein
MKRFAKRQQIKAPSNSLATDWKNTTIDWLKLEHIYTLSYAGRSIFQVDTPRRYR